MGRKKSKRTKPKRIIPKDETRFDCPKCNHERVVQCKILRSEAKGVAMCTVCESRFKCSITPLDKGIDIYHAWIDEIDRQR